MSGYGNGGYGGYGGRGGRGGGRNFGAGCGAHAVEVLQDHRHPLVLGERLTGTDQEVPVEDRQRACRWAATLGWVVPAGMPPR